MPAIRLRLREGKTLTIEGIGPVLFARHRKSKRIKISVKPFRGIRVSLPRWASFADALSFVGEKRAWILDALRHIQKEEQETDQRTLRLPPVDRREARKILAPRTQELAGYCGFATGRISIRNQKTIWGSCTGKNDLNLNAKLLHLPPELRDYVIMHELVHIKVKSHGEKFWQELERQLPGARQLSRQLRQFRIY